MHKSFAMAIVGAMLAAAQTPAQTEPTAAELLQKGIYAQETAGDLDGAIKIYRQIVDSHPIQREIAAQAQYRLGLTLLAKGDAGNASQEIQRLGWDFPDYKDLIAASKNASATPPAREGVFGRGGRGGQAAAPDNGAGNWVTVPQFVISGRLNEAFTADLREAQAKDLAARDAFVLEAEHDATYDFSQTVTLIGKVTQIEWTDPSAWVTVNPDNGAAAVRVSLESINARLRGAKNALSLGDRVVVTGAPARDGSSAVQATRMTVNDVQKYLRGNTPTK
jgi:tetratricopeptide (TPR) repeat protein